MNMKWHVGQEILPTISHLDGLYTLQYVRDFRWETENAAKQHFLTVNINLKDILSCRLYQSTFGFQKVAHYMIGFLYKDTDGLEKEIMFSIEARRPAGDAYAIWKGVMPGMYDMIYIWGTPQDLLTLRTEVRKEPVKRFNMLLNSYQVQTLFMFFTHKTNTPSHRWKWYNALLRNCITDLHAGLFLATGKLHHFTFRSIFSKGYSGYLMRKGIITDKSSKTL